VGLLIVGSLIGGSSIEGRDGGERLQCTSSLLKEALGIGFR
jgi:hypothetical protein